MPESTDIVQRNPGRELVEWVRSDETRQQIARALPEGVSIDRFERATATALLAKPELVTADRASLYLAILSAAQAGLVPDGKQGAIVVYNSKVKGPDGKDVWIEKAQFLPMIGGVRDILAEYGWSLRTEVVYESDEFEDFSSEGYVVHRKPRPGIDRGAMEGAYAMAVHRDGRREAVVMSKAEIDKVRDKSSRSKKVWEDWYERMAEKTPGHRLAKKLPLDPKDRQRIDLVLAADDTDPADAAALLYGPDGATFTARELPAAKTPTDEPQTTDPEAEGHQQAPPASPRAGEVPGDDEEPEPSLDLGDDLAAAAQVVASTEIPVGAYKGMTLEQVRDAGDNGETWLWWALRNASKFDDDFNAALETFVQGAMPELQARYDEWRAARAAA